MISLFFNELQACSCTTVRIAKEIIIFIPSLTDKKSREACPDYLPEFRGMKTA